MKKLILFSFIFISISCAPFQYSPFSDRLLHSERSLNFEAAQRIDHTEVDGKIRIAVLTDSHQNYKDLDQVIFQINRADDIDFVINLGDFTDSGYNYEYDQFVDSYVNLSAPAFSTMGNHDAIGAGASLFRKVFGDPNYFFETDSFRFIFFHSANIEAPDEFRPLWLLETVQASTKPVIILTHVSLRDTERYAGETANIFNDVILNSKVKMILNGHNHVYSLIEDNGTILLQGPRVEGNQWMLVEIQGSSATITRPENGANASVTFKN